MAYLENEGARIMDKFHTERFRLRKFKMEVVLASMKFWDIVNGSKKAPLSNSDPKVLKEYQRRIKKVMSIIGLNLVDNQFAYIKSYKELAEAWKPLCTFTKRRVCPTSSSFNSSSSRARYKFFT